MFFAITSGYAHFNNPSESKKLNACQIFGGLIDVATIATVATLAALVLGKIDVFPGMGITSHAAIIMLACASSDTLILIAVNVFRKHKTTTTKIPENIQNESLPKNPEEEPVPDNQDNPDNSQNSLNGQNAAPFNSDHKNQEINIDKSLINNLKEELVPNNFQEESLSGKNDALLYNSDHKDQKINILAQGPLCWNGDVMGFPTDIANTFLTTEDGDAVRKEILLSGYDAPPPGGVSEECYLAAHAIYPFLSDEGKQCLLFKMHQALFKKVSGGPTLNYLRSYSGATITLKQSENNLLIKTDHITLKISKYGALAIDFDDKMETAEGMITLIWNHMNVILTELDPESSKPFSDAVFHEVMNWFESMEASFHPQKEPKGIDDVSGKQCIPFYERWKGSKLIYQSGMFCNPVIASQDSEFCYKVIVDTNEDESERAPAKFMFKKQANRGKLGVGMERETSFQVFPDRIRVEIAKKNERDDGMVEAKKHGLTCYDISMTEEKKWKILAYENEEKTQIGTELYACVLQDNGTWQPVGEMNQKIEFQTDLSSTVAQNDLHYVLRSLITIRYLYTSPYTLVRREWADTGVGFGGCHLNGAETSVAMVQKLAQVNQGISQKSYAKINLGTYGGSGFAYNTVLYLRYQKVQALLGTKNSKKQIEKND